MPRCPSSTSWPRVYAPAATQTAEGPSRGGRARKRRLGSSLGIASEDSVTALEGTEKSEAQAAIVATERLTDVLQGTDLRRTGHARGSRAHHVRHSQRHQAWSTVSRGVCRCHAKARPPAPASKFPRCHHRGRRGAILHRTGGVPGAAAIATGRPRRQVEKPHEAHGG